MIPRVEPEGMLFRKPVPTPDRAGGRLFGIMLYRTEPTGPGNSGCGAAWNGVGSTLARATVAAGRRFLITFFLRAWVGIDAVTSRAARVCSMRSIRIVMSVMSLRVDRARSAISLRCDSANASND